MVFWLGLIIAACFAYMAVKLGFFLSWSLLFNIVTSVYLAIYLGPLIVTLVPGAGDTPYGTVLGIVAIALASFFIQHTISYTYITGPFSVNFPRIFDSLGSLCIGFLSGMLVWGFVSVVVCVMPISKVKLLEELGIGRDKHQSSLSYVTWWCDKINKLVAIEYDPNDSGDTITKLIGEVQANQVVDANDVNDVNAVP